MRPRINPFTATALNTWDQLGFQGVVGIVLAMIAAAVSYHARLMDREVRHAEALTSAPVTLPAPASRSEPAASVSFPGAPVGTTWMGPNDIPGLVAQLEESLTQVGLRLPSADYRYTPASAHSVARWEMRCTLRGDYPRVRRVLTHWQQGVPGFVMQGLLVSRPDSAASEVEAKLVIAVLLAPAAAGRIEDQGGKP